MDKVVAQDAVAPAKKRRSNYVLVTILALHSGLLAWAAWRDSPTWDEIAHLPSGIVHWQAGEFHPYRVNPPLVRMVAALPLVVQGVRIDQVPLPTAVERRSEFRLASRFIADHQANVFRLSTISRWACIPFSLLGALVCFAWARDLYGPAAGVLSSILWCVCPNVLGHGHLITPDVAAASMGVLAVYSFSAWIKQPSWVNSLFAGLILGLANLTKSTWLLLFLVFPICWFLCRRWESPRRLSVEAGRLMFAITLGVVVINAGYGFSGSFKRLGDYEFVSSVLSGEPFRQPVSRIGNRFAGTVLGNVPVPLPEDYVQGIDIQRFDFERNLPSYLRGEWRFEGWWYYYLYACLIKVPIGTLLLGLLACGVSVRRTARWREELLLLAPAIAVFVLVSSQTGFSHHLRYVLPAFPFFFIWIGKVWSGSKLLKCLTVALTSWSAMSSLSVYPHSLAYFNELVGGTKYGHLHLGNSNTDWGQDLFYIRDWYEAHPEARPFHFAYDLPFIDPAMVGIESKPVPVGPVLNRASEDMLPAALHESLGPLPGWFAISVNQIHHLKGHYEYFLEFEPIDTVGSTFIYHITLEEANRVRRKLGMVPLNAE